MSVRSGNGFFITAAGCRLGDVRPRDLVRVQDHGIAVDGNPSSEVPVHLAIYRLHPGVGAIVHTHSPHATAMAGRAQGQGPEGIEIGQVGRHRPGSEGLAAACAGGLGDGSTVLLIAGHGVLAVGHGLVDAVTRAELVEEWAQARILDLLLNGEGRGRA